MWNEHFQPPTSLSVTLSEVEGNLPVTLPVALESFWLWKKLRRSPHCRLPAANWDSHLRRLVAMCRRMKSKGGFMNPQNPPPESAPDTVLLWEPFQCFLVWFNRAAVLSSKCNNSLARPRPFQASPPDQISLSDPRSLTTLPLQVLHIPHSYT